MQHLFKRSWGIALVLSTLACGSSDDAGSNESPEGTSGSTANTGTAGKTASNAGSKSPARAGTGGTGTVGTAGSGTSARAGGPATTQPAAAGKTGTGGKSAAMADEDAGVPTAGHAAAGSSGTAGHAAAGSGGTAGHAGSKAGSGGSSGAAGSGGATAATFTQVYALITSGCAGSTCHVSAAAPGGMLSMPDKATAYTNLVNADATQCRGEKRVVPGDPAKSELVASLKHIQVGSCARTPRMPDNKPQWKDSDIAVVSSWIEAGAQNN